MTSLCVEPIADQSQSIGIRKMTDKRMDSQENEEVRRALPGARTGLGEGVPRVRLRENGVVYFGINT